jgi:metal-responsive CopG/Arc/MetJ family transcriptional regulator
MTSNAVQSRTVERIIVTLPRDLLDKLNELARQKGLTRGAFIRMTLTEYVREQERE